MTSEARDAGVNRPLRVGVAGTGFGAAIHVPGFRAIPGVEVVGVAGRDIGKARAKAAELGIAHAVGSVDDLLKLDLDAVSIALPPAANAAGAWSAVRSRTPVLCEKPLALDANDARGLAAAAEGIVTAVDYQFGELACFQKLRDLVVSGRAGAVRRVEIAWLVESHAHRTGAWSWKVDRAAGGGVMTLLGTHVVYLLEWLCGPLASLEGRNEVSGHYALAPEGSDIAEDTVHLKFDFESGATGSAEISNARPGGLGHRWRVVFEDGEGVLWNPGRDYMHGFRLTFAGRHGAEVLHDDGPDPGIDGRLAPFSGLASRFIDSVRTGRVMHPDFDDAARATRWASVPDDSSCRRP